MASSLDVPNVVRVLAIGDASAPFPFLAMERLRGDDLGTILRKDGRMGATAVIELARQVGRGLSAAAAAGIVHRDIKPQNLFRAEQDAGPPMWKVLDFGVSKLLAAGATQTEGKVVGTPIYMAPEQAQGHEVDHRADLYGLGAVVYRCLTGYRPFRTQDIAAALYDLVTRMPARPGALADLPPEVDDVLLIARWPSSRPIGSAAHRCWSPRSNARSAVISTQICGSTRGGWRRSIRGAAPVERRQSSSMLRPKRSTLPPRSETCISPRPHGMSVGGMRMSAPLSRSSWCSLSTSRVNRPSGDEVGKEPHPG